MKQPTHPWMITFYEWGGNIYFYQPSPLTEEHGVQLANTPKAIVYTLPRGLQKGGDDSVQRFDRLIEFLEVAALLSKDLTMYSYYTSSGSTRSSSWVSSAIKRPQFWRILRAVLTRIIHFLTTCAYWRTVEEITIHTISFSQTKDSDLTNSLLVLFAPRFYIDVPEGYLPQNKV